MSGAEIVYIVNGGYGGSKNAYQALCALLHRITGGKKIFFAESLREGQPQRKYWRNPCIAPYAMQAAHIADFIQELKDQGEISPDAQVHLVAHSKGGPEALLAAVRSGRELGITEVILLCTAGLHREWTAWLGLKILWMILHDVTTSHEGRNYWRHSGPYFFPFRRTWRSLREAWCISHQAIAPQLIATLRNRGISVKAGFSKGDHVFSYKKDWRIAEQCGAECFNVPEETGHNPQKNPSKLEAAFKTAGILPS